MKITYKFVTGEVHEVEVSAEIGAFITASRREEMNGNRRQRYHCAYSLDGALYEGDDIEDKNTPESDYLLSDRNRLLHAALATLTPTQRRRLEMFAEGMSYREIARREGVDHKKIMKSIKLAQKKIQENM